MTTPAPGAMAEQEDNPDEVARDLPAEIDPIDVVTRAPARMWTRGGVTNIGPLAQDLPAMLRQMLGDRADVIALSGLLWGAVSQLFNRIGPLQQVANEMPLIVAHSDEVHSSLTQGQDAIRAAVTAVQQAAQALTSSLGSISQIAAQAYAASALANSKITALEARVAALEARKVQTWRATGNLPQLALNATTTVLCSWSVQPTSLPSADQCTVIQVAGASATLTVTAVSATGATVTVKALSALLPVSSALQVVGVSLS